jgi:hypothetical protein
MERALRSLLILATVALGAALAQGGWVSLRGNLGAGATVSYGFTGSLGLELEWLDPTLGVYPRGSVAYLLELETLLSSPLYGILVEAGGAIYSNYDRSGLFGAIRAGGGLLVENSIGTFVTTLGLTGGYRMSEGPIEMGLEGGLRVTSTDLGDVRVLEFSPLLRLSAGIRF